MTNAKYCNITLCETYSLCCLVEVFNSKHPETTSFNQWFCFFLPVACVQKIEWVYFLPSHCPLSRRGMSGTTATCPGTSLGIPKYTGHVPGQQYPRKYHVRGPMDPGILSIPGFLGQSWDVPCQGSPWILEYLVSWDSRDHPGMSHARAQGSWNT